MEAVAVAVVAIGIVLDDSGLDDLDSGSTAWENQRHQHMRAHY
jgi:hypothetical protein